MSCRYFTEADGVIFSSWFSSGRLKRIKLHFDFTCSLHGHGEGNEEICEPDEAVVARVEDSEDVVDEEVGHAAGEGLLDEVAELLLVGPPVGEVSFERGPKLHNLKLCEACIL